MIAAQKGSPMDHHLQACGQHMVLKRSRPADVSGARQAEAHEDVMIGCRGGSKVKVPTAASLRPGVDAKSRPMADARSSPMADAESSPRPCGDVKSHPRVDGKSSRKLVEELTLERISLEAQIRSANARIEARLNAEHAAFLPLATVVERMHADQTLPGPVVVLEIASFGSWQRATGPAAMPLTTLPATQPDGLPAVSPAGPSVQSSPVHVSPVQSNPVHVSPVQSNAVKSSQVDAGALKPHLPPISAFGSMSASLLSPAAPTLSSTRSHEIKLREAYRHRGRSSPSPDPKPNPNRPRGRSSLKEGRGRPPTSSGHPRRARSPEAAQAAVVDGHGRPPIHNNRTLGGRSLGQRDVGYHRSRPMVSSATRSRVRTGNKSRPPRLAHCRRLEPPPQERGAVPEAAGSL